MAAAVVDALELVDVEKDQGQRAAVAPSAGDFGVEELEQIPLIPQPGEIVGNR